MIFQQNVMPKIIYQSTLYTYSVSIAVTMANNIFKNELF